MSPTDAIDAVFRAPLSMAEVVVRNLPRASHAGYLRFLDMMFHYTRESGERLRRASRQAGDPLLAGFFASLAASEDPHFRLAEADLQSFGLAPSIAKPEEVSAFDEFWDQPGPDRDERRLGALYALEGVAEHLADDARAALGRLGIEVGSAQFVLEHLSADVDHGREARAHVERVALRSPAALAAGASAAAHHWLAMHEGLWEGDA